jgi:hypothetical protein
MADIFISAKPYVVAKARLSTGNYGAKINRNVVATRFQGPSVKPISDLVSQSKGYKTNQFCSMDKLENTRYGFSSLGDGLSK